MPAEDRSKLEATGVTICTERILRLEGESGSLRRCTFESGAPLDVEALFFSIGTSRSSDLAEQLGCAIGDDDVDIRVDDHRRTTVEGVWAVGDLVEGSKLVVTAAADGAIAAIDINSSLLPPARRVK
ncbi:MAG TPA: FAD-dependent oxidoreductase, partial [Thermoanaerobaculia bacterium]|nr:FAD-dependent oxidoreductase [Thermoanaerobaculia bacterium]